MSQKIIYIANIRLPTEKAHGIQIMKMCQAFLLKGVDLELIVTNRRTPISTDSFEYYAVKERFPIHRAWSLDWIGLGRIGFLVQYFSFTISALCISWNMKKDVIYYTRDELVAFVLGLIGKNVVWEAHRGEVNVFGRFAVKHSKLVVISRGLASLYESIGARDVLVSPDAVDLEQFDIPVTQSEAREKLNISKDAKIVLYSGHLYQWKGAHVLAEAVSLLSQYTFIFVGGTDKDIVSFKKEFGSAKNIMILGRKPHQEIPVYLKAADVLVLPNSAKEAISRLYTSPLKLFEYMSSGRPIVASDLPSIREVLNEKNAVFFTPDDMKSLVQSIDTVLVNKELGRSVAQQALRDVKGYTWHERASKILEFIGRT